MYKNIITLSLIKFKQVWSSKYKINIELKKNQLHQMLISQIIFCSFHKINNRLFQRFCIPTIRSQHCITQLFENQYGVGHSHTSMLTVDRRLISM